MPIPLRQDVMNRTPSKDFADTTAIQNVDVRANATLSLMHAQAACADKSRQTDRDDCSEYLLRDYPNPFVRATHGSRTTARDAQSRRSKGEAPVGPQPPRTTGSRLWRGHTRRLAGVGFAPRA